MKILLSTRDQDPKDVELLANDFGFAGLEVNIPSRREDIGHKQWTIKGVKTIQAIHAPIGKYDQKNFTLAVHDALFIAKKANIGIVNIHPPSAHKKCGGRQNVVRGIKIIKKMTQRYPNIAICYEVLAKPTKDYHVLEQAYESPEYWLADVKEFNLNATLDTTHIASWGEDPALFVTRLGNHLRHIHISDYSKADERQHLFPGEGDIDWLSFFEAVKSLNRPNLHLTFEQSSRYDFFGKDKARLNKSLEFVRRKLES